MGPENRLIQAVSKLIPSTVYREKMHNPYRGGTPDMWYSGRKGDLWVEWKWSSTQPKLLRPALSELQKVWLRGRSAEGRTVAVVVGLPTGCVWFQDAKKWEKGLSTYRLETKAEIAKRIEAICA